ncbi:hypothetical protein Q6247_25165, partial [Klebsiella pneumoniae]
IFFVKKKLLQALGILKAALHSKTVLTDAFLAKKTKRARVSGRLQGRHRIDIWVGRPLEKRI